MPERVRLFDMPHIVILMVGLDGVIARAGAGCRQVLGYQAEEMIGKQLADYVHPDDRSDLPFGGGDIPNEDAANRFETRFRASDSSYRILAWTASFDAEISLWFCIAQDVTGRKAADLDATRHLAVTVAINTVFRETLVCDTEEEAARVCLSVAIARFPPHRGHGSGLLASDRFRIVRSHLS